MQLSIEEAEQQFIQLLDRIEPRKVAAFLDWIIDSFAVVDSAQARRKGYASTGGSDLPLWMSTEIVQADAILRKIALEMRSELPVTAVLDSEVKYWPSSGLDSDCNPETTVHVDSFLYEEDDVDDLVDEGRLCRNYCTKCGSREIKPLTFISHSLSVDQLRYMFTALVPLSEAMSGRLIVDVGSRLGAVLYASYLYGGGRVSAVGIEINKEFCILQRKTIEDNAMDHRIKVINDDVRNQGEILASADVVVLNNVFCFFLPPQEQVSCWNFLYANIRGGAVIISNPTLEAVTEHLELPFSLSDWVTKVDTTHLAARFSGTSDELYEDCEKLTLYSVLHRTAK
uniref:Methyltransferase type 11 domain-containing protein n=1 Tax=Parascaris univalens TaxID=6257 RepID=A0A915AHH1_PARUN